MVMLRRKVAGQRRAEAEARAASGDPYEDAIARAIAVALGEQRAKWYDRRFLAIYAFVVLATVGLFFLLDRRAETEADRFRRFASAIIANCQTIRDGNERVNILLGQLETNAQSNPARSPEERRQIAETYRALRLPVSQCPPIQGVTPKGVDQG
jgi:hypothetical protein